jgi:hypothetical protein
MPESLYNISIDASGQKRFGVIIITEDPAALEQAGIDANIFQKGMATAKLTIEELRRAANIAEVKEIRNTSKSFPQ